MSYERLARTPVQWPSPPQDATRSADDGRNPIRYLNDGVSQQLLERPDGTRPRLAFATTSGRAVFFPRPHMDAREMPDDDYPFVLNTGRLQHQWHTLTKTGKVANAQQAQPRAVRRDPPRRRRPALDRRRRLPGDRVPSGPRRPARVRLRPGPARQPLRPVPLERRLRRVPGGQRGHQRRRRPALVPAGVQGVGRRADQARDAASSRPRPPAASGRSPDRRPTPS